MTNIYAQQALLNFMSATRLQLNILTTACSITAGAVVGICCILLMDRYSNVEDENIKQLKQRIANLEKQLLK